MLYLLGGTARTGKTTIAHAFLAQKGIPFFSLDFLMMGFANGLPEIGVDSNADELLIAEQLWPVICAMATAMIEEEVDYLLEGVQLHPKLVCGLAEKFPCNVCVCFVGFAEMDTMVKFQEIRRFGGQAEDWMRHFSDEQVVQEVERLKLLSVRVRAFCQKYGLKYIETSSDWERMTGEVIQYFLNRDGTMRGESNVYQ